MRTGAEARQAATEGQQRVGALVELPHVLRSLGKDPARVIPCAGIDPAVLRNPENALSLIEVGRLFQTCVDATGCQHFGPLIGQRSACASLGLVGRLMQTAPTFRDAILDLCTNHHRYIRGTVAYLVIRGDTAFWGYAVHQPGMQAIEQLSDGAAAVGFNMMRELVGISPDEVLTSRAVPADVSPYRGFFGLTPRFDAEQHALAFPAGLLSRPVRGADPELRRILAKSVANYWAVQQPGISDLVIRLLRARTIFDEASLEEIAANLSIHPRTLNRRLRAAGTSFRILVNEARYLIARQLLAGTRMEVTDIGLALGYAEPSGFTHAFQRWSGIAPSQWRERL